MGDRVVPATKWTLVVPTKERTELSLLEEADNGCPLDWTWLSLLLRSAMRKNGMRKELHDKWRCWRLHCAVVDCYSQVQDASFGTKLIMLVL